MKSTISIRAGYRALDILQQEGLQKSRISTIAGASGGPKFLVLNHLDRFVFGEWLNTSEAPVLFIGSSIGAWRAAALAQNDPLAGLQNLTEAYIAQDYTHGATPQDITRQSYKILDGFLDMEKIAQVLSHPWLRVAFLSARGRAPWPGSKRLLLIPELTAAYAANRLSRRLLSLFVSRMIFYDSRAAFPFSDLPGFRNHPHALSKWNFRQALLASGSIPLVMEDVTDIPEVPPGNYRDGGMIDYHHDLPLQRDKNSLVFYPHFYDHIVPGWLDKRLRWRHPAQENVANMVLVSPSQEFVNSLPYGKIPDRKDFDRFTNEERFRYWEEVANRSREVAEDFREVLESGTIGKLARPIKTR